MPDDPRDASTPEEQRTPWAARRSLTPPDGVPSESEPDEATPRRSIFNRFRRARPATEDLQTHLVFPEEEPPTDDLPTLEPARSPWRRPTSEDSVLAPTSDATPATPAAAPPTRPMPPIEAILPAEVGPEVAASPAAATVAAPPPPAPPVEAPAVTSERAAEAATPPPPATPPPVTVPPEPAAAWLPLPAPTFEVREYDDPFDTTPAAADDPRPSHGWAALRPVPVPVSPYMLLLTGLATLVTLAYLLVEPSPRWFLILGATAVAAGLDGTLRATWRVTYADRETTPALFMPAIFILAVPPLIEHNVRGLGVVPAGLAAGLAFFAIVAAQVGSARPGASYYPWARTVSTAGAYAAGFAFFSLTYVYDLGIGIAALATGLVALMLAIEVLREGEIDATETAGYAAAAGAAVGQWRLALHYLPVDGYLAGLAVLLGFLLVTGLLQAYITRSLDRRATVDHAVVALAGAALVIGARVAGLA